MDPVVCSFRVSQVHTASAWGVKLSEPLVILLHIRSVSRYLDGLGTLILMCGTLAFNKLDSQTS